MSFACTVVLNLFRLLVQENSTASSRPGGGYAGPVSLSLLSLRSHGALYQGWVVWVFSDSEESPLSTRAPGCRAIFSRCASTLGGGDIALLAESLQSPSSWEPPSL